MVTGTVLAKHLPNKGRGGRKGEKGSETDREEGAQEEKKEWEGILGLSAASSGGLHRARKGKIWKPGANRQASS